VPDHRAAARFPARPFFLAAGLATVLVVAASGGRVSRMTIGDGVLYRYVAQNLNAGREQVEADLGGHGTVLRYGRIGFPALLWLASAGQASAMPYAQPALMVIAAGVVAAASCRLLNRATPGAALAPFIAFALPLSLTGGFAEPIAVAFAMWAVVMARDERWVASSAFVAATLLTRENAAGLLLGLVVWALIRKRPSGALILGCSFLPVGAWHLVVHARYGAFPLADPWLGTQVDNVGAPVASLFRALGRSSAPAVAIIVIHLVVWGIAVRFARRSDLALVAAFSGIGLLVTGAFPWRYLGDGLRLEVFLEIFFVCSVAERLTSSEDGAHSPHVPLSRVNDQVDSERGP
jgi:hypothetical protein